MDELEFVVGSESTSSDHGTIIFDHDKLSIKTSFKGYMGHATYISTSINYDYLIDFF